ncbi:Phosphorylated carbohydrates phosphatase [Variovorax sp. PBL-H6]|uniref:HAD-IA family hydrolase n=1 Tax=Variovorax sp. PBL-H6 TaxID=434009 RepID=UPI001318B882|nr:HAD-IA family hydrolase [Variovorax sp. PBL-H6]VTU31118.1 Phosphorylated carbohydrates phosphatase [Variovorax sp. PBL-H6]
MSIEAIVFDVDGTLADTEEVHRRAFNLAFGELGLDWRWERAEYRSLLAVTGGKERLRAYIDGLALCASEKKRLREQVPELHAAKTRHYTGIALQGGLALRPGVARLLEEAIGAGLRLAIASTTTAVNIDALLLATLGPCGLSMFDVIACGDQVRAKKPAPDIYRLALDTMGVAPERAIAVEDSANGLRSALAAGLWTLVTPTFWTEGGDFSGAGLVLPSLGDREQPLDGEPGERLQSAAWLGVDELTHLATAVPPVNAVQALYRGE